MNKLHDIWYLLQDMQEPMTYITILNLGSLQWFDLSIWCYKKQFKGGNVITLTLGVLLIILTSLPAPHHESTQMSLWEKFRSAHYINIVLKQCDDRKLILCEWHKTLNLCIFRPRILRIAIRGSKKMATVRKVSVRLGVTHYSILNGNTICTAHARNFLSPPKFLRLVRWIIMCFIYTASRISLKRRNSWQFYKSSEG